LEWLKPLLGHTVGLDTAPLIYFMERHPVYLALVQPFFEAVERGDIEIVTSTITLTEVLIHPLRQGDPALARQYSRVLLNASHVQTLAVSPQIATEAAELRARWGYTTPDAIQLATAKAGHATFFVTNDGDLASAPGLQVVALKQLLTHP
jgi:predicted nucleic acid-binding protein